MAPRANARRFFNGANIMIKHKKFKTVSGYLRSNEYRILSKLPTDRDTEEDRRRRVEVVQAGQREAINQLLPQIGIPDRIVDSEAPRDGVARLIAVDGRTAHHLVVVKPARSGRRRT
jgi:hypothetical protein